MMSKNSRKPYDAPEVQFAVFTLLKELEGVAGFLNELLDRYVYIMDSMRYVHITDEGKGLGEIGTIEPIP